MHKLNSTKKLTLGAMTTALTVLSVYAAGVLPSGRIACYFLSSIFIYILTCEGAYLSAITSFLASSLILFFILPDRLALIPYALLLGHFGIFKSFVEAKVKDLPIKILLKLVYCNAFFAGAVAVVYFFTDFDLTAYYALLPLPVWALVLILEAAFVLYDCLFSFCQKIYETRLRSSIIPRR